MPLISKINIDEININESYLFFEDKKLLGFPQEAIKYIQKQAQIILELEQKAMYDELTGLLNREGLKKYIEKFKNQKIDIILCDLDNLGKINNENSFSMGDQAITIFSEIIKKYFRTDTKRDQHDLISRLGGDEFLIIGNNIPNNIFFQRYENIITNLKDINQLNLGYEFSGTLAYRKNIKTENLWDIIDILHSEIKLQKKKRN